MSDNAEICNCGRCIEWRTIVKELCKRKGINYDKLLKKDKTTLYHWGIHTDEQCKEHNWNIMRKDFEYAMNK